MFGLLKCLLVAFVDVDVSNDKNYYFEELSGRSDKNQSLLPFSR